MTVARIRQQTTSDHPLDFMPFMRKTPARRLLWVPALTENYEQNYCIGRGFGWEMAGYIRSHEACAMPGSILGPVVREMIEAGTDGRGDGTICGFMASIADAVVGRGRP